MVIHMFAFRWAVAVDDSKRAEILTAIRGLQNQIPGLLETHVGLNFLPRGLGYELGGVMKFESRATFDAYAGHPAHQALLQWLVPLIEPVEIDFEA